MPKKALKEKEKAEKAFGQNRTEEAISHLEALFGSIPSSSGRAMTWRLFTLRMNDPQQAIEQLNEAIKFDPRISRSCSSTSPSAISKPKASAMPNGPRGRRPIWTRPEPYPEYLLAVSLYFQKKFTEEALRCATQTSNTIRRLISLLRAYLSRGMTTNRQSRDRRPTYPVTSRRLSSGYGKELARFHGKS